MSAEVQIDNFKYISNLFYFKYSDYLFKMESHFKRSSTLLVCGHAGSDETLQPIVKWLAAKVNGYARTHAHNYLLAPMSPDN